MSKEHQLDNVEEQLEKFLNRMIPIKYPEVNSIIVIGKKFWSDGNFRYDINVNPTFDGVKKLNKNPEFEHELLEYIKTIAQFGTKMFNTTNTKHYVKDVKFFWD